MILSRGHRNRSYLQCRLRGYTVEILLKAVVRLNLIILPEADLQNFGLTPAVWVVFIHFLDFPSSGANSRTKMLLSAGFGP
jgi:hypothetical protein